MDRRKISLAALVLALSVACEEESTTNLGGLGGPCDLSLDNLAGTAWVMDRINPDRSTTPDHKTRVRFRQEGDSLKAEYNVSSIGDMYTYDCTRRKRDVYCLHDLDKDFVYRTCASMEVQGVECTTEAIKARSPGVADADLEAGVKEAKEDLATKFKDKESDAYKQYEFAHSNLGNKLQFVMYAEVEKNTCEFMITDDYFVLYEGKWREDSNPVGRNAFEKSDEDLWWEDCQDYTWLFARKESDFPSTKAESISQCRAGPCAFGVGDAANFLYVGENAAAPEEGCTYSMDIGIDGKPVKAGVAAEITKVGGKDRVHWGTSHSFTEPGLHAVAMARNKTCNGTTERIDVACAPAKVSQ